MRGPAAGGQSYLISAIACFVFAMLAIRGVPACAQQSEPSGYELTFPAMGTELAFQAFCEDESLVKPAFDAARAEVERVVDILSDYNMESETVLLSRPENVNRWQNTSSELWDVLQVCDRWYVQSHGAFDASIGQLTQMWRKARKNREVPTATQVREALGKCGWVHVHLDRKTQRVLLDSQDVRLDFGAMGKGYIIERAYEKLRSLGLPQSLVRAGGDLRCGDSPPGRDGWKIEIARLSDDEPPLRFTLANAAVSSSGDLYQYMDIDGKRRSHVLDPRDGWGVLGPRLVTVIARTATEADAADTALCAMDPEEAMKLARSLGNLQVRYAVMPQGADRKLQIHIAGGESGAASVFGSR